MIFNGISFICVVFNYELEYEEDGMMQKFFIDVLDVWLLQIVGVLVIDFFQDGSILIFILLFIVWECFDCLYMQINVIGIVIFDNGSEKNVYVKIFIYW